MADRLTPFDRRIVEAWNEGNTAPEVAAILEIEVSQVYTALARARRQGLPVKQRQVEEHRRVLPRLDPAEVDARMDLIRMRRARPAAPRPRQPWVSIFDRVPDPLERQRRGPPAVPEMAQRFR